MLKNFWEGLEISNFEEEIKVKNIGETIKRIPRYVLMKLLKFMDKLQDLYNSKEKIK
jgi:hypothetical protein